MSWKKLMKWKEHVIKEYLTHGSKNSQEKLDSIFNCMLTKPLQHLWDTAKTILRGKSVALKFYLRTSQKFKIKRIYRMNIPNSVSKTYI